MRAIKFYITNVIVFVAFMFPSLLSLLLRVMTCFKDLIYKEQKALHFLRGEVVFWFFLIDLYWSIIASQYCVSFCCTTE